MKHVKTISRAVPKKAATAECSDCIEYYWADKGKNSERAVAICRVKGRC